MNKKQVIIYGGGVCFREQAKKIFKLFDVVGICDRKYISSYDLPPYKEFEGLRVVLKDELDNYPDCNILICIYNSEVCNEVAHELEYAGISSNRIENFVDYLNRLAPNMSLSDIMAKSEAGVYLDCWGNRVVFPENMNFAEKITIDFCGCNAEVIFEDSSSLINKLDIHIGDDAKVIVGANTTFDNVEIVTGYANVIIGEDCMFSSGISIRTEDGHMIFDKKTGKRINYNEDIVFGNHVWIGLRSTILKGAKIDDGAIIGAGSVVTRGHYKGNCVYAGNPAKLVREDVEWERPLSICHSVDHIDELW